MKELELLLENAMAISDDKIFDAVAFSLKANATIEVIVVATCSVCIAYPLYKFIKYITDRN